MFKSDFLPYKHTIHIFNDIVSSNRFADQKPAFRGLYPLTSAGGSPRRPFESNVPSSKTKQLAPPLESESNAGALVEASSDLPHQQGDLNGQRPPLDHSHKEEPPPSQSDVDMPHSSKDSYGSLGTASPLTGVKNGSSALDSPHAPSTQIASQPQTPEEFSVHPRHLSGSSSNGLVFHHQQQRGFSSQPQHEPSLGTSKELFWEKHSNSGNSNDHSPKVIRTENIQPSISLDPHGVPHIDSSLSLAATGPPVSGDPNKDKARRITEIPHDVFVVDDADKAVHAARVRIDIDNRPPQI